MQRIGSNENIHTNYEKSSAASAKRKSLQKGPYQAVDTGI